jgi:hypothetical protein
LSADAKERAWRSLVGRLLLELVVVFIGVYAAFALAEHQVARESAERRHQLQLALMREIEDITNNTRNAAVEATRMIAFYDSAFTDAATPIPVPMLEPVRVRNHMWDAVLNSNALDLLDVELVYRLSDFYNELNAGFAVLEQLRGLSETMLLPNLSRGPAAFYDEKGHVRPEYGWYFAGLRNLREVAASVTTMGDSLFIELGNVDDTAMEP